MSHLVDEILFSAEPLSTPVEQEYLVGYLQRQFQSIQSSFQLGFAQNLKFFHAEPEKPHEGLLVGADGTNWNPGAGEGVYCYYAGTWNRLG